MPNKSRHETYIDIEPLTGTPVDFIARIQVNVAVDTNLSSTKMPSMIFPTLWQEFSIHITEKMAQTITSQIRTPKIAAFCVAALIGVLGISLTMYGSFLVLIDVHRKRISKQTQTTPLLSDQDQTDIFDRDDSTNNNSVIHTNH